MPSAGNPHNPCGKTVTRESAYEVWQTPDGSWTWYVLKKYQSPEKEAQNPLARWFCLVTSPFVGEEGEMGDVYVIDIKGVARKITDRTASLPTVAPKARGGPRESKSRRAALLSPQAKIRGIRR